MKPKNILLILNHFKNSNLLRVILDQMNQLMSSEVKNYPSVTYGNTEQSDTHSTDANFAQNSNRILNHTSSNLIQPTGKRKALE